MAAEVPQHRLRLLAVGNPPPFKQEIRDGVRYELPAPEGTIPPRAVKLPALSEDGTPGEGEGASIKVRLGQTTAPATFTAPKDGKLSLRSDKGLKWLDLPLQACGASLALVWRGGKDWSEPRAIVVPDDAVARAEGSVHFTNLTAAPMAVVIGTEKIRLEPGKTFDRKLAPGAAALPLDISYPVSGGLKSCHSSSLEFNRGNFHRIIIYAADVKDARMPVKVLQLEEPG
ncbi:hypothetical protein GCM10023212_36830 [Luteolibacter yonseiensis]